MSATPTPGVPISRTREARRGASAVRAGRRAGAGAARDGRPAQAGGWASRVALAAMVAPAGFFAVMMVLGFVTPGYDWVARYGSELSLGSPGWIMIANFVALGLVELAIDMGRVGDTGLDPVTSSV